MYQRQTELSLEQLIGLISSAPEYDDGMASSFELPTIGLIANEIGTILLITTDEKERISAEDKLVELLEHSSGDARQFAYFFFLKYRTLAPNNLSQNSRKVLHKFEGESCNMEIVNNARAAM